MNTTITHEMLRRAGACTEQRDLFLQHFPDGVRVTVEQARRHAHDFDFAWAAEHLLTPAAREQYEAVERPAREQYAAVRRPAWEQYEAVRRPAWEQYEAVRRTAREQYEAVRRTAREQYEAVERPAREQYEAVERPAREQYEAVAAMAFADAVLTHGLKG